jgi:hypothetical protein
MPYPIDPTVAANRTHNANLFLAELTKQTALAGTPTAAAAKTADLAFQRAVLASANAAGVQPGFALEALKELGVNS